MTDATAPVRAVVFDLDGTLVDSLPAIRTAILDVCGALDLPRPNLAAVKGFVGAGVPVAMDRLLRWAEADAALHERAVAAMAEAYPRVPVSENRVLPGARDMLAALADRGLALALCTNKPRMPAELVLRGLSLGPFASVVCGDDGPARKPDAAMVHRACAKLRVPVSEAVYVGDSEIDHGAAAAAGMRFVLLEGGYLNAPLPSPMPWGRIRGLAELPGLLLP